jgi:hypothetical protein
VKDPVLFDYAALLLRVWIVGRLVLAARGEDAAALGPALGLSQVDRRHRRRR